MTFSSQSIILMSVIIPIIKIHMEEISMKKFVCTICGYVAERETLPDGYQCPICRANRDKFVKV